MSNIVLRGSTNASEVELVCLAMETGIDSLLLKSLQYPYAQRRQHEYSSNFRKKQISDRMSEEIQTFENTFLGCNIEQKMESIISVMIIIYLVMVVFGIVVYFCYDLAFDNDFYMVQAGIAGWKIVIYHATNYIIFIPVTLMPIFKLFIAVSGMVAENNISKR
jgi:hypothetical protein